MPELPALMARKIAEACNILYLPGQDDCNQYSIFVSTLLPELKVIPVVIPGLQDLARAGGVLNCISWQLYY